MEQPSCRARRCAIYTRKSSAEGLEQDFNSLHAQRDACESFIKSQAAEGWRLVKTAYDDGGLSGGTMERPASRRALQPRTQRPVCGELLILGKSVIRHTQAGLERARPFSSKAFVRGEALRNS